MTANPSPDTAVDVTIFDRAHEAHRMHVAGADWRTIADTLGYASSKTASMAVTAYLQKAGLEHSVEDRTVALQLEIDRLDALQAAVWDRAVGGDLKATAFVVGLIERRVKLLGLDRVGRVRGVIRPRARVTSHAAADDRPAGWQRRRHCGRRIARG